MLIASVVSSLSRAEAGDSSHEVNLVAKIKNCSLLVSEVRVSNVDGPGYSTSSLSYDFYSAGLPGGELSIVVKEVPRNSDDELNPAPVYVDTKKLDQFKSSIQKVCPGAEKLADYFSSKGFELELKIKKEALEKIFSKNLEWIELKNDCSLKPKIEVKARDLPQACESNEGGLCNYRDVYVSYTDPELKSKIFLGPVLKDYECQGLRIGPWIESADWKLCHQGADGGLVVGFLAKGFCGSNNMKFEGIKWIRPNDFKARKLNVLGLRHLKKNDFKNAISAFSEALKLDDSFQLARFNKVCALSKNKSAFSAIKADIEKLLADEYGFYSYFNKLKTDPDLKGLQNDKGFLALMAKFQEAHKFEVQ